MNQTLFQHILAKQSFLCIGLDTQADKLPSCVLSEPDPVFAFNQRIIDATVAYTVAYKPNLAFYEARGWKGMQSLERTVAYLKKNHPEVLVIADAKRGDIGNTAGMYARSVFEVMDCDAVTVAPYMGSDSVKPFLKYPGKQVIVLALTSNEGAADFQFLEDHATGECLFERVLRTASGWASPDQMMFVVGATRAEMLQRVRAIVPDHFLLVPGVGAQGGSLQEVARYGMNRQCGLLVNSSRAILYGDSSEHFAETAAERAREMQQEMAGLLRPLMESSF
jgi:orotidine-5'-phosphate decarboxylase